MPRHLLLLLLFLVVLPPLAASARPYHFVVTIDDLRDTAASSPPDSDPDFAEPEPDPHSDLDPGSWRPIVEPLDANSTDPGVDFREAKYASGVRGLFAAVGEGDAGALEEAVGDLEASAGLGFPHSQSALGFLYGAGIARPKSQAKAFMYHQFAQSGNMQSKMALAYNYLRREMYEEAVELYEELAEVAVASFLILRDPPVIELEPIRLHNGAEENKEDLRKYKGEDDEDFQVTEYQAMRGNAEATYKVGMFYYFGLRGMRQDHGKALYWFSKAVEKGEPRSMELLGEIYVRGSAVERNYTKAFEWLTLASRQKHFSAYNGLGYLYVKGYGVGKRNYTKARDYFEKAANNGEPGGHYNLGVLYLKGIGIKRDPATAFKHFVVAANAGQPKALYQVAKMFQKGISLKRNLATATLLYKRVAERGPWSSLLRWALESYLKGDIRKAFFLYSRMAELGYEVAQSNAAWILDKYGQQSMCMGESGFCTDTERHLRAHSLWWQASEQGNEHAALLIGDAYYYGRGTERDYERAAEAYMHAQSQSNAQAMFNLGYMHEHGHGLPSDLHLAKRYYDQALENDPAAKLPVTLALTGLWIRKNYMDSFLVRIIDSLPLIFPQVEIWVDNVIMDEGNATIAALLVCLLTVLYLRDRQRRHAVPPLQPDGEHN